MPFFSAQGQLERATLNYVQTLMHEIIKKGGLDVTNSFIDEIFKGKGNKFEDIKALIQGIYHIQCELIRRIMNDESASMSTDLLCCLAKYCPPAADDAISKLYKFGDEGSLAFIIINCVQYRQKTWEMFKQLTPIKKEYLAWIIKHVPDLEAEAWDILKKNQPCDGIVELVATYAQDQKIKDEAQSFISE